MTSRPTILAFLKAPVPGTVKTRLAKEVGDDEAVRIYRRLVARQMNALPTDWLTEIHFAPAENENEMRAWLGAHHRYHPQCEGDLGDRLLNGVQTAFAAGATSVYCIGGDCPDLGEKDFLEAQRLLAEGHDLVFGPTTDGGYYLVAMTQPCPEIFREVPWSEPNTLKVSLRNAKKTGRNAALLGEKFDVDELADWIKTKSATPRGD